jgi:hypothetical protein
MSFKIFPAGYLLFCLAFFMLCTEIKFISDLFCLKMRLD